MKNAFLKYMTDIPKLCLMVSIFSNNPCYYLINEHLSASFQLKLVASWCEPSNCRRFFSRSKVWAHGFCRWRTDRNIMRCLPVDLLHPLKCLKHINQLFIAVVLFAQFHFISQPNPFVCMAWNVSLSKRSVNTFLLRSQNLFHQRM